jgi:hypothetical protein
MPLSVAAPSLLRWFGGLSGLAAVLGALVSLSMPLALYSADRAGAPIVCGSGWHAEAATARREDSFNRQQHLLVSPQFILSDYAGECAARVVERRWLAIGVAGGGAAAVVVACLAPGTAGDRPARRHVTRSALSRSGRAQHGDHRAEVLVGISGSECRKDLGGVSAQRRDRAR